MGLRTGCAEQVVNRVSDPDDPEPDWQNSSLTPIISVYTRAWVVTIGGCEMRKGLAWQRLVAVFLAAVLLFNYPLLSLFDRAESVLGVPILYLYLFAAWVAVIAAITWVVERGMS
jgi:lysylphosphatidylglycerol synthetase-like protein (DUF2156 family)